MVMSKKSSLTAHDILTSRQFKTLRHYCLHHARLPVNEASLTLDLQSEYHRQGKLLSSDLYGNILTLRNRISSILLKKH